jgi:hypothetical protein
MNTAMSGWLHTLRSGPKQAIIKKHASNQALGHEHFERPLQPELQERLLQILVANIYHDYVYDDE